MALYDSHARRHDEAGWAMPVLMLLVVIALALWLIVQVATNSSNPSVNTVESATAQIAGQVDTAVNTSGYATCTYDASSWTVGQRIECTVWTPIGVTAPAQASVADTAVLTVQSPPPTASGHYVSILFGSGAGPYLVNLDTVIPTSSALASSHYALARA
jgi:hypothetical protein